MWDNETFPHSNEEPEIFRLFYYIIIRFFIGILSLTLPETLNTDLFDTECSEFYATLFS